MKFPTLKTASQWRIEFPGMKALILGVSGRDVPNTTLILKASDPAPEGLFRFFGYID